MFVTSQGSPHGRFSRAIRTQNLWAAEMSLRELRDPSLVDLLDYLELLAEVNPGKLETAAVRWHGRLETETQGRRSRMPNSRSPCSPASAPATPLRSISSAVSSAGSNRRLSRASTERCGFGSARKPPRPGRCTTCPGGHRSQGRASETHPDSPPHCASRAWLLRFSGGRLSGVHRAATSSRSRG
jgi:hypothetical protein